MTKLEEISALLVGEIQQFESAVKKLEEIQKLEIQLDLRELHNMMSEYQENLKKLRDNNSGIFNVLTILRKRFSVH